MGQFSVAARARRAGFGLTGKAPSFWAMESMAASWMELPKTASGAVDAGAVEGGDFDLVGGDGEEVVGDEAGRS